MGARLVRQVIEGWPDLPDRPWRVLIRMAFVAHDEHKVPKYYKGRDDLVAALGLPVGQPHSYRMVRRAITDLVDAGAVKRLDGGNGQRRQRYQLTLTRSSSDRLGALASIMRETEKEDSVVPQEPVENPTSETRKGDSGVPHMGDSDDQVGGLKRPSRGTQESPGGLHEEEGGTRGQEEQSSSPSSHLDETGANSQSDLNLLQAKRILRDTFEDNGRALIHRRPFGMSTDDGAIWAAYQVLAGQAS